MILFIANGLDCKKNGLHTVEFVVNCENDKADLIVFSRKEKLFEVEIITF